MEQDSISLWWYNMLIIWNFVFDVMAIFRSILYVEVTKILEASPNSSQTLPFSIKLYMNSKLRSLLYCKEETIWYRMSK